MTRRNLFRIFGRAAIAGALLLTGMASPVSASATPWAPPGQTIPIIDPDCPDCDTEPPADLVAESETDATLTMFCEQPSQGTLLVEVDLDDGRTIRIHRDDQFSLCTGDDDVVYETPLYAGPDWTWDVVSQARISVVQD